MSAPPGLNVTSDGNDIRDHLAHFKAVDNDRNNLMEVRIV